MSVTATNPPSIFQPPKLLQVEPTSVCNFKCDMCLHASGGTIPAAFMETGIYERLAREIFPALDTLLLYGWGEPFLHPDFIGMLRVARRHLKAGSVIKVTSNGSLLDSATVDILFKERLMDCLNISCDRPSSADTVFPGHHAQPGRVFENLDYALRHPLRSRVKIGIETVVMRSNIAALPELVERFGRRGADFLLVSHVFPYHPALSSEMLYPLMSSEACDVFRQLGDLTPQDWFGLPGKPGAPPGEDVPCVSPRQAHLIEQARLSGIKLNYALYQRLKNRLAEFESTHAIFEQARMSAARYAMQIDIPPVFGVFKERSCPYVQCCGAVVRADGALAACFKNMYPHRSYFHGSVREYPSHSFGSIVDSAFADIWNCAEYRQFRSDMQTMNEHIAWCGDCSFSLYYCYFLENALHDCMLNAPFCADCPFSLNLTRCAL